MGKQWKTITRSVLEVSLCNIECIELLLSFLKATVSYSTYFTINLELMSTDLVFFAHVIIHSSFYSNHFNVTCK